MDPTQVVRDRDGVMGCRQCGFAYTLSPQEIADRVEASLQNLVVAVADVAEPLRGRRPSPGVWSVNAYVSHLADAAGVINGRVRAIAETDRPVLLNHDQDCAVEEGRADDVPAHTSLDRLMPTAREFNRYLVALHPNAWRRVGIHSIAGEIRLSDIAHDMAHELEHHVGDIRRVGGEVRSRAGVNTHHGGATR